MKEETDRCESVPIGCQIQRIHERQPLGKAFLGDSSLSQARPRRLVSRQQARRPTHRTEPELPIMSQELAPDSMAFKPLKGRLAGQFIVSLPTTKWSAIPFHFNRIVSKWRATEPAPWSVPPPGASVHRGIPLMTEKSAISHFLRPLNGTPRPSRAKRCPQKRTGKSQQTNKTE